MLRSAEDSFLRKLGLVPRKPEEVYTAAFWDEVRQAGGNPLAAKQHGEFSVEAFDALFATEDTTKRVLGGNYRRLLESLTALASLQGRLAAPKRVVDLGGGAGIAAMRLAQGHPDCKCVVYDRASRPLHWGRKWAAELDLKNIRYVQASYEELAAAEGVGGNDLVLFLHGADFDLQPPGADEVFLHADLCRENSPEPREEVQQAINAVAQLLSPNGVAMISCHWSEWGLIELFEAIRRAGLGVDWGSCICKGEIVHGHDFVVNEHYIFAGKGIPHLGRNSWEDARGFIATGQYWGSEFPIGSGLLESYADLFRNGDVLMELEVVYRTGQTARLRLLQEGGLLLLEDTASNGCRRGGVHGIGAVPEMVAVVNTRKQHWEKDEDVTIRRFEVHPRLQAFLDYVNMQ